MIRTLLLAAWLGTFAAAQANVRVANVRVIVADDLGSQQHPHTALLGEVARMRTSLGR